MTPAQTQPGADMDAQVARMMGWTQIRRLERGAWRGTAPDGPMGATIPAYSTDWSCAALVVHYMKVRGWHWKARTLKNGDILWNFWRLASEEGAGKHASAPACICLAALAATGGEG